MTPEGKRRQEEIRQAEKRRVSSMLAARRGCPPPSQDEVDREVAAFLARGGQVTQIRPCDVRAGEIEVLKAMVPGATVSD